MFRTATQRLADWGTMRLYSRKIIATIDGIQIVSLRKEHSDYLRIISSSLSLLRDHDEKRMDRVVNFARWIVDRSLAFGARSGQYCENISAIEIDFEISSDFGDDLRHSAYFAGVLVHEATHGFLSARGFIFEKEARVQIERICVQEENRFLTRMNAVRDGLGDSLMEKFDVKRAEESWKMGRLERLRNALKRVFEK